MWKTPKVVVSAQPAPVVVHQHSHIKVDLDGQPFRDMTITQIDEAIGELADLIPHQPGG